MQEEFIKEIKKHKIIYDKTLLLYRNKKARAQAWDNISHALDIPVLVCQKRWKSLRERYVKEVIQHQQTSGSESRWEYFDMLYFLEHHVQPKKAATKDTTEKKYLIYQDDDNDDDEQKLDCELLFENSLDGTMSTNSSQIAYPETLNSISSPPTSTATTPKISIVSTTTLLPPTNSNVLDTLETTEKKKLKEKEKRRASEDFSSFLKEMKQIAQKRFCPAPEQSEDHSSFFAMCKDLFKKLPDDEEDDAKMFILNHLHARIKETRSTCSS